MKITRRHGTTPAQRGCGANNSCPDVLELENNDFLVIGKVPGSRHINPRELMRHAAKIGTDETAVVVPGDVLRAAAQDIVRDMLASRAAQGTRPGGSAT